MANKKTQWLLPTNTENLKMIIAQGLIASSDGFAKYYHDVLELVKGYVPLFKNKIPEKFLTYVLKEDNSLTPAIIEIDLKKIESRVGKVENNKLIYIDINNIENETLLLIKAPLPLSVISTVIFSSNKEKETFSQECRSMYSNASLKDLKLSSTIKEQVLFKQKNGSQNLPIKNYEEIEDLEKIEVANVDKVDYKKVYAYGGLLLNLFYFAKNGKHSNDHYQLFCNLDKENEKQDIGIYDYFKSFDKYDDAHDDKKKMDNKLIDLAINSKSFKEDVLEFLESDSWGETTKKRTAELANKLKAFENSQNKTVSKYFAEAKTPLEKILFMLFLREDSGALMDYKLKLFNEKDYLNFAMMFGIRDKFIKVPKFIHEFEGVQNYISAKMANYAHQTMSCSIKFKEPKKPLTMFNMLQNNSFKKLFAKELKAEQCFETIIPKSDYKVIKGKPVFTGIVIPEFKILDDEYFQFISTYELTEYDKWLKIYEKVKWCK